MSVKQLIVVRTKYNTDKGTMSPRRGKIIAQASHASMLWLVDRWQRGIDKILSKAEREWLNGSMTKICTQVDSEEELLEIYNRAKEKGLVVHIVTDLGKTEFDGPTRTCCAVGPDYEDRIDEITKDLRLY